MNYIFLTAMEWQAAVFTVRLYSEISAYSHLSL